ncbi:MAG: dTDP-4-dehydrorhamnose 3,5-epimerase [Elusimicrobia bacterium]|nr:dTDP-4-dehydrorhamnose 3,5-epimerase [Elusimicrobiota bacterium]
MGLTFTPYQIPGLLLVEGKLFPDSRGHFMESYREIDYKDSPVPSLVQDNLSRSRRGVVRGLHYQKNPSAIGKLVRCVAGRILDVAVDIRKGSPTYGKWAGVELRGEENRMLWVPPGFAHGFYVLSEWADVLYKVSGYWVAQDDCGVLWNDPAIGIAWPSGETLVSDKDARLPILAQADNNFSWRP